MTETFGGALEAAVPQLEAGARRRLERYGDMLAKRNATLNLTAARTPEALAEHVRDSLTLVPYLLAPLVDVGSGGGFPALPLAIVTGIPVTFVESVAKKAHFLEAMVGALGLEARVVVERAEEAARRPELRETFGSATARALGSAPTVLELTVPFLRVGGLAILQRGALDARERAAAADAALVLGAELVEERPQGEDTAKRLLLVRKRSRTGQRFPRRVGVPARRPLCFEAVR